MEQDIDERLQEPLDDEERELMDPETWDWESVVELEPVANPGVVVAIRLSREEFSHVDRAARAEDMMLTEYMKQSALRRAMQDVSN